MILAKFFICSLFLLLTAIVLRFLYVRAWLNFSARTYLLMHYVLIFLCLALPAVQYGQTEKREVFVINKVDHAEAIPLVRTNDYRVKLQPPPAANSHAWWGVILLMALGASLWELWRYLNDLRKIQRLKSNGIIFRNYGRLSLVSHPELQIPMSFSALRRSYVYLPESYLGHAVKMKLALQHELTHIRHRDTHMAHLLQVLIILFGWNPFFRMLIRSIKIPQELACDEAVLARGQSNPKVYGQLLIAAENLPAAHNDLICAHRMVGEAGKKLLRWRIILMVKRKRFKSRCAAVLVASGFSVAMSTAAVAASHILDDGEVSVEEAYELVQTAKSGSQIPLYVDEYVVKWLNFFLTEDRGRSFMRHSLSRMSYYQDGILGQIRSRSLPEDLISIPLIESGFINHGPEVNSLQCAGMWQIIPATGRRLGLTVNEDLDERLNLTKATTAALDYLELLYQEFGNWHLAMIAYNKGERGLRKAIAEEGTTNVTQLRRKEKINDYMSKAMAAILILQRPDLVEK